MRRVEADAELAHRRSIALASEDWHPGVIGIVASRLVERFYRPTVLIAIDTATAVGRGSGRSIHGFNLYEALKTCRETLLGFGGHRMAAGLSIHRDQVRDFCTQFESAVHAATRPEDFQQRSLVDAELPFDAINDSLLAELAQLEPHGPGNAQPVFLSRGVTVVSRRCVGDKHLKLHLRQGNRSLAAIGFGMAEAPIYAGDCLDVLFSPEPDDWNGSTSIQLRLRDVRPGHPA